VQYVQFVVLQLLLLVLLDVNLANIIDWRSHVVGTVRKRTMSSVFHAIAFTISFMYTSGRFVITQVITLLRVARIAMHIYTIVTVRTYACLLIVFITINVRIVVECAVALAQWSASPLILEMPIKTSVWSVLCTFVLQKQGALFNTKALEIRVM